MAGAGLDHKGVRAREARRGTHACAVFFMGDICSRHQSRRLEIESMMAACRHRITLSRVGALIARKLDFDQSGHAASSTSRQESGAKVNSAKPLSANFASVGISTLPREISSTMYSAAAV